MNLPNKITLVRIFLVPVILLVYLLQEYLLYAGLIAAGLFLIAALTDFLDGYLARKLNLVTDMGVFLDTNADKMLSTIGFVILIATLPQMAVPNIYKSLIVAFTGVSLCREFLITALKQLSAIKGIVLSADKLGKYKAAAQFIALNLFLAVIDLSNLLSIDIFILFSVGFWLLAVATLLSILSAINYFVKNKKLFDSVSK